MPGLGTQYESSASQAWLRLWVSLYGPGSRLTPYLKEPDVDRPAPTIPRAPALDDQTGKQTRRHSRPSPLEKTTRRSTPSLKPRTSRRIERDVDRVKRLPTSEWAQRIMGDERISNITLQDVLDAIDDYFEIFDGMRKYNRDAYNYFSRVGPPLITRNSAIWRGQIDTTLTIANPHSLPSYFGIFLSYDQKDSDDGPWLGDFHLFEKPKNHATVAPFGTTIFTHNIISLKRKGKTQPWNDHSWGVWWYVGIEPSGQVRALPHRMQHYQSLPGGDGVHHSRFTIPPALYEMGREKGDPHKFVREIFNGAVAMTAAGVAGIQVTIRRGKKAIRLGLPVTALRNFFADRDPGDTGRRRAIIHFRHGHDRHMKDGRIIAVGEHLSGERFFYWRGYDITIGVPGIHYPAPEAFNSPIYIANDPDAPLPPDYAPDEMVGSKWIGNHMREGIWKDLRVPIRRGQPTETFRLDGLPRERPAQ